MHFKVKCRKMGYIWSSQYWLGKPNNMWIGGWGGGIHSCGTPCLYNAAHRWHGREWWRLNHVLDRQVVAQLGSTVLSLLLLPSLQTGSLRVQVSLWKAALILLTKHGQKYWPTFLQTNLGLLRLESTQVKWSYFQNMHSYSVNNEASIDLS